ncbi:purine nucleoside permease [Aspergillus ambiguus]|uniref:purine-nucleoside phosphorylase n=1 Tax=Aspergillus ambiguus TaxID=176160 RepID=UPI003CCCEBC3
MQLRSITPWALCASACLLRGVLAESTKGAAPEKIAPKVFIVSMFEPEAAVWWGIREFDLLAHNITVPGASPLFPDVHCTADYEICQLVTGEGEINAAVTVSSIAFSPQFDLTQTYFLLAGIAGISPKAGTLGGVAFSRFAVQVALQHEIDIRELPSNFSTSYFPQGGSFPFQYPGSIYGTEVFEVNDELRSIAASLAKNATLADAAQAQKYRRLYASNGTVYAAGAAPPAVVECDVATSDVYYSGHLLSGAFEKTFDVWTNGTGKYCTTAQEDNATLEALLRAAMHGKTDFARIIVMRTGSDFDRPPHGVTALQHLVYEWQGGYEPAVANLYNAGVKVVNGIVNEWDAKFAAGIKPKNNIGDIFGSLGGKRTHGRRTLQSRSFRGVPEMA